MERQLSRRGFMAGIAGASALAGNGPAFADTWPSRATNIVVPFPAGGTGRLRATTALPETLDTVLGLDQPVSVFDDAERLVGCITPRSLLLKIASTRHAS